MPFAERRLTNPTTLSTVASTVYTVPSQYTTIVKQVVVTNTTASPASFNLYIGSATSANAIFSNTTISANDSLIINLSQVLSSLEILTASANANSAINMTISGVENNGPLDPANVYIADGAITTSKLANSSVTSTKIAANAVTNTAILDDAVSTTKIANSAITTDKISTNNITQTKLDTTIPLSGFRNAIINGAFDVWQRSTSVTPSSGYGYTADRWLTYSYASNAATVSRVAFTPGTTLGLNQPQYHARVNSTSTAMYFGQRIEDVTTFAGQTITISFYAKHQNSFSVPIYIEQNFGTGGSSTVSATGTAFSIGTSWQRYTHTLTLPSLSGKTIGTSSFLDIYLFSSAVNNYLDIWGFQVELGSQPTPFERRFYGIEMQLCQRYYEISNGIVQVTAGATGFGGNTYWSWMPYQVEKRISLNYSTNTAANGLTVKDNAGVANQLTYWKAATQYTATNIGFEVYTNKGHAFVHNGGQTDAGLARYSWIANAEL